MGARKAGTMTLPVYALGERALVEGFALAGATVVAAEDHDSVVQAWTSIPDEAVVLLTPRAAAALVARGVRLEGRLRAVMPT